MTNMHRGLHISQGFDPFTNVWRVEVPAPQGPDCKPPTVDAVERQHVESVLSYCEGNKTKAVEILGFDRRTLYRKLKRWGVATTRAEVEARADRLDAELSRLKEANGS